MQLAKLAGVEYAGSTRPWGGCRRSSILRTPTLIYKGGKMSEPGNVEKELELLNTKKMTVHYRDLNGKEKTAHGSKKKMIAFTGLMIREKRWIRTDHY